MPWSRRRETLSGIEDHKRRRRSSASRFSKAFFSETYGIGPTQPPRIGMAFLGRTAPSGPSRTSSPSPIRPVKPWTRELAFPTSDSTLQRELDSMRSTPAGRFRLPTMDELPGRPGTATSHNPISQISTFVSLSSEPFRTEVEGICSRSTRGEARRARSRRVPAPPRRSKDGSDRAESRTVDRKDSSDRVSDLRPQRGSRETARALER